MVDKESKLVYSIMVRFPKDREEDDPRGFGSTVITSSTSITTLNVIFVPDVYEMYGNVAAAKLYAFDPSGGRQINFTLWDDELNIKIEDAEERFKMYIEFMKMYDPDRAEPLMKFITNVRLQINRRVTDIGAENLWNQIKDPVLSGCKDSDQYTALIAIITSERDKLVSGKTTE